MISKKSDFCGMSALTVRLHSQKFPVMLPFKLNNLSSVKQEEEQSCEDSKGTLTMKKQRQRQKLGSGNIQACVFKRMSNCPVRAGRGIRFAKLGECRSGHRRSGPLGCWERSSSLYSKDSVS